VGLIDRVQRARQEARLAAALGLVPVQVWLTADSERWVGELMAAKSGSNASDVINQAILARRIEVLGTP
jgi:hypothetical protein